MIYKGMSYSAAYVCPISVSLFCAGLVASSVSSNRTGLDMASILQNKLGQKDTDELGTTFTTRLKYEVMLRL